MKFHVYVHRYKGDLIYVGMGSKNRPYSRQSRNKAWRALVGQDPFDVQIMESTDDQESAIEIESHYIKTLKPTCNVRKRGQPIATGKMHWAKNTAQMGFALPPDLKKAAEREAARRGITLSRMLRDFLNRIVKATT